MVLLGTDSHENHVEISLVLNKKNSAKAQEESGFDEKFLFF